MNDKLLYIREWLLLVAAGFGLGCVPATGSRGPDTGPVPPTTEVGRAVRVVDGDTYDVLAGGVVYRVRLLGVDAPELGQPFGRPAADSVAQLLGRGRRVQLTRQGLDLYGRTLGAIRLLPEAGAPVALDSLLVVRGWAWAFDPAHAVAGRAAQQLAAQRAGRGLWKCGTEQAVPPKLWRSFNYKNKRRYGVGCTW